MKQIKIIIPALFLVLCQALWLNNLTAAQRRPNLRQTSPGRSRGSVKKTVTQYEQEIYKAIVAGEFAKANALVADAKKTHGLRVNLDLKGFSGASRTRLDKAIGTITVTQANEKDVASLVTFLETKVSLDSPAATQALKKKLATFQATGGGGKEEDQGDKQSLDKAYDTALKVAGTFETALESVTAAITSNDLPSAKTSLDAAKTALENFLEAFATLDKAAVANKTPLDRTLANADKDAQKRYDAAAEEVTKLAEKSQKKDKKELVRLLFSAAAELNTEEIEKDGNKEKKYDVGENFKLKKTATTIAANLPNDLKPLFEHAKLANSEQYFKQLAWIAVTKHGVKINKLEGIAKKYADSEKVDEKNRTVEQYLAMVADDQVKALIDVSTKIYRGTTGGYTWAEKNDTNINALQVLEQTSDTFSTAAIKHGKAATGVTANSSSWNDAGKLQNAKERLLFISTIVEFMATAKIPLTKEVKKSLSAAIGDSYGTLWTGAVYYLTNTNGKAIKEAALAIVQQLEAAKTNVDLKQLAAKIKDAANATGEGQGGGGKVDDQDSPPTDT